MTRIEKAIKKAAEVSPSIMKLLELQDAYTHAVKRMQKSEDIVDVLIYKACKDAIKNHSILMAEKAEANTELLRVLKEDEFFNWHETIYVFLNLIPSVANLVEPLIEEIE